jgi:hypothetical protein
VRAITQLLDSVYGADSAPVEEPHTFDEARQAVEGAATCPAQATGGRGSRRRVHRTRAVAKHIRVGLTIRSPCCARTSMASPVARRPSACHAGV